MVLGAQLYTVRDFTKDLDSLAETLKKVADIGYTSVQISATCAFESDWMKEQLEKNGLACPVAHIDPSRISGETEKVVSDYGSFGCGVIGIGCAPGGFKEGYSAYEAFRDEFLPVSKNISKTKGAVLGYHNHHMEFTKYGEKNLIEQMAGDFSADELSFILDTYWVQYSGGDPSEWIQKLKGRIRCIHYKDMAVVGSEQRMAAVGGGNLNFERITRACVDSGVEYVLVEQDNCYGEDPFDCLTRSYKYLKSIGLK